VKRPKQKYFEGDLVIAKQDLILQFVKEGDVGMILLARCDKVCVKGGIMGLDPSEGGATYGLEWCYVARFGAGPPQGTRVSSLTPLEVIHEIR